MAEQDAIADGTAYESAAAVRSLELGAAAGVSKERLAADVDFFKADTPASRIAVADELLQIQNLKAEGRATEALNARQIALLRLKRIRGI